MATIHCPECGSDFSASIKACPQCGFMLNGTTPVPPANGKLTPEQKAWALQHFRDEDLAAGLCEIEQTGGLELKEFIEDLEQEAQRRE
jgi:hypothetical protein